MALIPIAGLNIQIDDPDYRYKMPRIMTKVEGRGNGIKTVVTNMLDVALAIHREAGEVTKFFGCELGAQTSWKEDTEKSTVNGQHTSQALQTLLAKYIQNFVLCGNCHLPETNYKIKNGLIFQKCAACGEKTMCDMEHKLTTYILNFHKKSGKKDKDKDSNGEKKEKKSKDKDKEKKKDKDKKKKKDKSKSDSPAPEEDDSEHGSGDADLEEEKKSDEDDDDLVATMDNLTVEDAGAIEAAADRMKKFLEENPTARTQDILEELRMQSTMYALPVEDRIHLFVKAAFDEDAVKQGAIKKYKEILRGLILSVDPEGYSRRIVAAFEYFCAVQYPEQLKWFPAVLKQLYDEDVLEEDVFLDWYADEGRTMYTRREVTDDMISELRENGKRFITWLEEAEDEEEEEDEDDEEEA